MGQKRRQSPHCNEFLMQMRTPSPLFEIKPIGHGSSSQQWLVVWTQLLDYLKLFTIFQDPPMFMASILWINRGRSTSRLPFWKKRPLQWDTYDITVTPLSCLNLALIVFSVGSQQPEMSPWRSDHWPHSSPLPQPVHEQNFQVSHLSAAFLALGHLHLPSLQVEEV